MSSPAARERSLRKRTNIINKFCADYVLRLKVMNNDYQLRVENLVDMYPVNGRYCILQTGERGDWDTDHDLRQLMLRAIPDHMPHLVQKYPDARVVIRDKVTGEVDETATQIGNYLVNRPEVKKSIWQKIRQAIRRGEI